MQLGQALIGQPERGACHRDLAALPVRLRHVRRGDVHLGRIKHRTQERRGLFRRRVLGRGLGLRALVKAFDLPAGQRPVAADLDGGRLLKLAQMVVEAVRGQSHGLGELLRRTRAEPHRLEQADPQRIGQGAVDAAPPAGPVAGHRHPSLTALVQRLIVMFSTDCNKFQ